MNEYIKENFGATILIEDGIVKHYTNYADEVKSIKYGVGIYNRSESAIIKFSGNDVLEFLQRLTTNDVSSLESYHYITTLFTNEKGRLIDRTSLIKIDDDYYLVGSKKNENVLLRWIEKYIITEDVQSENYSNKYVILDIIGPQAESYLTLICGKDVDGLDNNVLHRINIEGINGFLLKKESYNEKLYWLLSEVENEIPLVNYLLNHKSVFDLSMIGEEAFNHYRVINKIPAYPNEINDKFNPHEAGLINDISFNKGCYIGQEIIARLKTYDKVQKSLQKVIVNGKKDLILPFELHDLDNNFAGVITTLVKSNKNNHLEGLGYIKKMYEENKNEMNFKFGIDKNDLIKIRIVD